MNRAAQTLVLTALGGVALRVAWTGEYARYVNEWMRWPLFVSGLLLVGLALNAVLDKDGDRDEVGDDHEHSTTRFAWLLLLPVLVAFVVQPPALGSYVAQRRANDLSASAYTDAAIAPLPADEVTPLPIASFVARAATDDGSSLVGGPVRLTGFVTSGGGDWFVTRLAISCCAADAAAFRVRVDGVDAPADEQWIEVEGTWVEGTGVTTGRDDAPALLADDVTLIGEPDRPYE